MNIVDIKIGTRFRKDCGDLSSLVHSIKELGLLHPIVVSESGDLIAGFRRVKAFQQLGIDEIPATVINLSDLRKGERDENEARLNLNPSEAVEVERYFTSIDKIGQGKRTDITCEDSSQVKGQKTREKVAKRTGYSFDTLKKAKAVVEAAEQEPEKYLHLQVEMNNGKRSVASAFAQVKEAKRKEKINDSLKEINMKIPDNLTLYEGNFSQIPNLIPESIQLILTDPPYLEENLNLWDDLSIFAEKMLIPGGFLIAYCGHYHLPAVLEKLGKHLDYFWTIALIQKEQALVHSRHVYCMWKPIIVFNKAPLTLPTYFGDVINGNGREKEHHEWQQGLSELESLIKTFCPSNGIILDPFAGSGTTLIAAQKLGRKSIGIEIDPTTFKILQQRVSAP